MATLYRMCVSASECSSPASTCTSSPVSTQDLLLDSGGESPDDSEIIADEGVFWQLLAIHA